MQSQVERAEVPRVWQVLASLMPWQFPKGQEQVLASLMPCQFPKGQGQVLASLMPWQFPKGQERVPASLTPLQSPRELLACVQVPVQETAWPVLPGALLPLVLELASWQVQKGVDQEQERQEAEHHGSPQGAWSSLRLASGR